MVHDIDQERLLIDAHIFATTNEQRASLESRLSQIDTDLASVARAYEPLNTFPSEHEIWQTLWQEIGALRLPIQTVLELSRNNQDVEAGAPCRRRRPKERRALRSKSKSFCEPCFEYATLRREIRTFLDSTVFLPPVIIIDSARRIKELKKTIGRTEKTKLLGQK